MGVYVGKGSDFAPAYSELVKSYINKNGYVRHWDNIAKAPYLFNGSTFITYDDDMSLIEKCKIAKKYNIAGIMCWQYPYDDTHTLLKVLKDNLK